MECLPEVLALSVRPCHQRFELERSNRFEKSMEGMATHRKETPTLSICSIRPLWLTRVRNVAKISHAGSGSSKFAHANISKLQLEDCWTQRMMAISVRLERRFSSVELQVGFSFHYCTGPKPKTSRDRDEAM
nr:hypothetical protein CFP56_71251 [Quercus suber]